MANIASAWKRYRQSEKKRAINRHDKTVMKHTVADLREVIDTAKKVKKDDALALMRKAQSTIAHMASKGLIKKENASRHISRLASQFHAKFGAKKK